MENQPKTKEFDKTALLNYNYAYAKTHKLSYCYPSHIQYFLFAHPEGTGEHVSEAYRIEGELPQIDGVLDDAVWQQAEPRSGFIQLEPDRGTLATDDTEFPYCLRCA